MEDNWISILSTPQPWQAEIAKQILGENGIEAVIMNRRDSSYTVFGEVYEGLDVVEKISLAKTGPYDRPAKDIKMSIKVIEE